MLLITLKDIWNYVELQIQVFALLFFQNMDTVIDGFKGAQGT